MRRAIIALLAAVAVSGCASAPLDKAYLDRVSLETLRSWEVSAADVPALRKKAIWFIARYATLGLGDESDDSITSINAVTGKEAYNYAVRIIPDGERAVITVRCWGGKNLITGATVRNAGILADYLQTGTIRPAYISR